MTQFLRISLLFAIAALPSFALAPFNISCQKGAQTVMTSAIPSSTKVQQSYAGATVTVFIHGGAVGVVSTSGTAVTWVSGTQFNANSDWNGIAITINAVSYTISTVTDTTHLTLGSSAGTQTSVAYGIATAKAPIFSDYPGATPQANPLTCSATAGFLVYSPNSILDETFSGTGIAVPFTLSAASGVDPFSTTTGLITYNASIGSASNQCTAALNANQTLIVAQVMGALSSQSMACSMQFLQGGMIQPASGQTVSLTGTVSSGLAQIFDISQGGTVDLSQAKIAAVYPQWFGALCDGATDDRVPVQAAIDATGGGVLYVPQKACAISSPGLFLYPLNAGITIQPATGQQNFNSGGGGFIATSSSPPAAILTVLAQNVRLTNVLFNCRSKTTGATNGVITAFGLASVWTNVSAGNCVGDGAVADNFATTPTNITAGGTAGASTSTVTAVTNNRVAFGTQVCNQVMYDWNTANEEQFGLSSVIGNVLTIAGVFAHDHTAVRCAGNNDTMQIVHYTSFGNAGAGFHVLSAGDNNGFRFENGSANNNTLAGEIWSGSVHVHTGGNYQGNGGPAIQLGTTGATPADRGFTAGNIFGAIGDAEGNGFDGVSSVCDTASQVMFVDPSGFRITSGGSSCFGLGSSTTGIGTCDNFAGCTTGSLYVKNITGLISLGVNSLLQQAGTGPGLSVYKPSSTGSETISSDLSFAGNGSTNALQEYAYVSSGIGLNTAGVQDGTLHLGVQQGGVRTDGIRIRGNGVATMGIYFEMPARLPTSCAGKPTGTLWNDTATVKVCP